MDYLIHYIEVAGYFGYAVLFLIIFLESFPLTFFLPGDSLLFTTGFLASQGYFHMSLLVGVLYLAAISGYFFSYHMGRKIKEALLDDGVKVRWIKKEHLEKTKRFFDKYGSKTIIIGRFVPIVRSVGPTLAGAVEMEHKKFIRYNLVGGIFWTGGVTSLGFYLGRLIPTAHLYLTPIILGIIFVSLIPSFWEYYLHIKEKRNGKLNV